VSEKCPKNQVAYGQFDFDLDPADGLGRLKKMRRKNLAAADLRGCITVRILDAKMEIPV
jgi:hypothetical protein